MSALRVTEPDGSEWIEAKAFDDLAMMLRRMIWMARKETGDTSMKAIAGQANELLMRYGGDGSPLREGEP